MLLLRSARGFATGWSADVPSPTDESASWKGFHPRVPEDGEDRLTSVDQPQPSAQMSQPCGGVRFRFAGRLARVQLATTVLRTGHRVRVRGGSKASRRKKGQITSGLTEQTTASCGHQTRLPDSKFRLADCAKNSLDQTCDRITVWPRSAKEHSNFRPRTAKLTKIHANNNMP